MFFCNSGAEACEGAIKLARRYHFANGHPERWRIVTFKGAFHGRTLATIAAAGNEKYWENGFRNVTNSKRSINTVEDLSGIKIRTMQNNLYIDMFNGLGSNAVPMAVNELFSALETKAVDAQENPFTVIHAQKFFEVQKFLSTTGHAYDALVLLAGKPFWDKLSDADKALSLVKWPHC